MATKTIILEVGNGSVSKAYADEQVDWVKLRVLNKDLASLGVFPSDEAYEQFNKRQEKLEEQINGMREISVEDMKSPTKELFILFHFPEMEQKNELSLIKFIVPASVNPGQLMATLERGIKEARQHAEDRLEILDIAVDHVNDQLGAAIKYISFAVVEIE